MGFPHPLPIKGFFLYESDTTAERCRLCPSVISLPHNTWGSFFLPIAQATPIVPMKEDFYAKE